MTRVLVTGFEPFGDNDVNPSQLIAEALDGVVLPVAYARAADALRDAVLRTAPDLVVCFGLADKRTEVTVERFALNADESSNVDNEGVSSGTAIDPEGPVAYRSGLPVDEVVAALLKEGIPAAPSRDAGGFLCNHVFYVLMHMGARGGFVHVPPLDVLPAETLVHAARVIVRTCAEPRSAS